MVAESYGGSLQFEDKDDEKGPWLDFGIISASKGKVRLDAYGRSYKDGDNYNTRDEVAYIFDRDEMIVLHKYLGEMIEQSKPKPEWYMYDVPKTRVYKRKVVAMPGETVFDSAGYSSDRPWMCSGVPEDSRETCYRTWEDAMEWATMPSEKRIEQLEYDAKFEMGQ